MPPWSCFMNKISHTVKHNYRVSFCAGNRVCQPWLLVSHLVTLRDGLSQMSTCYFVITSHSFPAHISAAVFMEPVSLLTYKSRPKCHCLPGYYIRHV